MLPGLVKLYNETQDTLTIRFVDVGKGSYEGWPLIAVPTQFFFNADGTPFAPGAEFKAGAFDLADDEFTRHTGSLSYEELSAIAKALTAAE